MIKILDLRQKAGKPDSVTVSMTGQRGLEIFSMRGTFHRQIKGKKCGGRGRDKDLP